jgi:hypothetical protein
MNNLVAIELKYDDGSTVLWQPLPGADNRSLEAFKSLITWEPETLPPYDSTEEEPIEERVPFLSETFLYAVLGKDDARSFLLRLRRLAKLLGYDWLLI